MSEGYSDDTPYVHEIKISRGHWPGNKWQAAVSFLIKDGDVFYSHRTERSRLGDMVSVMEWLKENSYV